jgi:transposase-like protein
MSTTKKGYRIAPEVREQILKRIKEERIPVLQAAEEHGVSTHTIYKWLTKGASGHPSWSEFAKVKKENRALVELLGEPTVKLSTAEKKNWPRSRDRPLGLHESPSKVETSERPRHS